MTSRKIGILHPGNMGISIAASAQNSGNTVYWVSEGRSSRTRERAESETRPVRDCPTTHGAGQARQDRLGQNRDESLASSQP